MFIKQVRIRPIYFFLVSYSPLAKYSYCLLYNSNRSLLHLLKETKEFFRTELKKELECGDQVRFIKHWDILTIINDVLTVIGTALRLVVEQNVSINNGCQNSRWPPSSSMKILIKA